MIAVWLCSYSFIHAQSVLFYTWTHGHFIMSHILWSSIHAHTIPTVAFTSQIAVTVPTMGWLDQRALASKSNGVGGNQTQYPRDCRRAIQPVRSLLGTFIFICPPFFSLWFFFTYSFVFLQICIRSYSLPSFSHSSNKTPRPTLDGKRLLARPLPTWDKTRDNRELVHTDLSCSILFFGHSFTHYIHSIIYISIHSFNVNLSFLRSNSTSICYYFPSLIHAIVQLLFLSRFIFSLFLNILSFIHLFQQVFSSSIPSFIRVWFIDFLCSPSLS